MDGSRAARARLDDRLAAELEQLRQADLYRTRRAVAGSHGVDLVVDGRRCVNFCSNDYLGLAADPRVAAAARDALGRVGTGSGASALVSGYNDEHAQLEQELARAVGRPRALLFGSGWAANLGVLRALLGRDDALIADELNHASLIDGGRLSGARYLRVPHRDLAGFGAALQSASDAPRTLVVTDAVFSMDGDLAPIAELAALGAQHGASLMVDDAHGFMLRDAPPAEIYVATLGKALGCAGAFVAGSETLIEYLIQRARSWVFSTAPPPAIAAAAREALRIAQSESHRRAQLFANIAQFRAGAKQLGIALAEQTSPTPIQPLILGDETRALALSRKLFERGFWIAAIRPPTVPHGTARLRITLCATHTSAQIDALLQVLADGLKAVP
jgi:8-amino-7-oxononanoate synthase